MHTHTDTGKKCGEHYHLGRQNNKQGLLIALVATACIFILEFLGGLWTNSLALLSDSGHMLSDVSSLGLSFIALIIAAKPPSVSKTFGYQRFEILAALFNGVTLLCIAVFIAYEAYHRFLQPQAVDSLAMMIISVIGLLANLVSAIALMRQGDVHGNINLRSAYLHVLGDAMSSVGAIVAGVLMMFYSWYWADPLISLLVAVVISKGAWQISRQALHILMEGTPPEVNISEIKDSLATLGGVNEVHELHLWSLTSDSHALSCHLVADKETNVSRVLRQATEIVKEKFQINNTAIQIETDEYRCATKITS